MILLTPWERVGLAIGHATDEEGATGCTVVRGIDAPFRCAAALVGRASGTRELATCDPGHLVDRTDAILLTGGSAYGLDAAGGVMRWMEERGRGFPTGPGVVPIVPAAVIFDLAPLGRFDARPTADMAYVACSHASSRHVAEGSVGAGTGALVGKGTGIDAAMKGGVGIGSAESDGIVAAALAVVNAFGDVRDEQGRIIAGARLPDGRFADARELLRTDGAARAFTSTIGGRQNTTLAVVAVNVPLDKLRLAGLAAAATAGLHRRITPAGMLLDGDVIFAVAPIARASDAMADPVTPPLAVLEALAALALERAIERGVTTARGRDRYPGLADLTPLAF